MLETYVKTRIAVESFVRRQAELATSSECQDSATSGGTGSAVDPQQCAKGNHAGL